LNKILKISLFTGVLISISGAIYAQQPAPCSSEQHRQFDFWVGEWEVKNPNNEVVGNSIIEIVSNDCALLVLC
tara:strand:- start:29 stop:247 length:219 start_codon:yes stop_codon:yes gene_type:complete